MKAKRATQMLADAELMARGGNGCPLPQTAEVAIVVTVVKIAIKDVVRRPTCKS